MLTCMRACLYQCLMHVYIQSSSCSMHARLCFIFLSFIPGVADNPWVPAGFQLSKHLRGAPLPFFKVEFSSCGEIFSCCGNTSDATPLARQRVQTIKLDHSCFGGVGWGYCKEGELDKQHGQPILKIKLIFAGPSTALLRSGLSS